jgi:hypothetical protein
MGLPLLDTGAKPKDFNFFYDENLSKSNTILLSAYWPVQGKSFISPSYGEIKVPITYKGKTYPLGDLSWAEPAFRQTFVYFLSKNKQIIFAHDIPRLPYKPNDCFNRRPFKLSNMQISCDQFKVDVLTEHQEIRRIIEKVLLDYPAIKVFDPLNFICDDHICYAKKGGRSLRFVDDNHLSMFGSEEYARAFKAQFPDAFK